MKRIPGMMGVLAVTALALSAAEAKLELPRVFGEGMVVQREKPARVGGWGDRGDVITVAFNGQTKTTKAAAEAQAWERKAAAARKVLEDYDAWQKKRKPAKN